MQQTMTPQMLPLPAPELGAVYSYAWERGKQTWGPLLLVGIVAGAVFGIAYIPLIVLQVIAAVAGASNSDGGTAVAVVMGLLAAVYGVLFFLATIPLTFGGFYAVLKAARGEAPQVGDLFSCYRRHLGASIGAGMLMGLAIGVGSFFFIIPGLILAVKLIFVPFLVADEGLGAIDALKESWRRTEGYFWPLVGAGIVGQLIMYAGALLFGVGMIPAAIWVYLALATYFAAISAVKRPIAA